MTPVISAQFRWGGSSGGCGSSGKEARGRAESKTGSTTSVMSRSPMHPSTTGFSTASQVTRRLNSVIAGFLSRCGSKDRPTLTPGADYYSEQIKRITTSTRSFFIPVTPCRLLRRRTVHLSSCGLGKSLNFLKVGRSLSESPGDGDELDLLVDETLVHTARQIRRVSGAPGVHTLSIGNFYFDDFSIYLKTT